MKLMIALLLLIIAFGCSIKKASDIPIVSLPSIATTEQKEAKIAWEVGHPERSPWTQYLLKVIDENKSDLFSAQDIQIFCPKFGSLGEDQKKLAIAQLFSAISKFESDFVPTSRYVETTMGKDCITNKQVVSEGLFQLSYCDKTWQPKCAFDWEKDKLLKDSDPRKTILDPYINTECAVSIMAQQVKIKKKIVLSSGVYWAVLKDGGKYSKIDEIAGFVRALPFCQ